MGKGGCTAAGRAARSKAQGQPDLSEGCVRRDDAYKVFILIRFLLAAGSKIKCAAGTLRAYLRRRTDDVYIVRIQPQLSEKGALGHSPKRVLVWGPRRDARPAGERRSGGALEGCLSHRDSDPTWSKARDDAHE